MTRYDAEHSLLARIAWMYYIQGLTQEEIGRKLEFSRTKITRLLARAHEVGIVEIHINTDYRSCLDTEEAIRRQFGLAEVIVVPASEELEDTRAGVGRACADYLGGSLVEGEILGCAWGRSLYHVGRTLRPRRFKHLTVVQLMGGLNPSTQINPQGILELIASKLNAVGLLLNSPAIVGTAEIKQALLSDEGIRRVADQWSHCTKALLGIGDMTGSASLIANRALSAQEAAQLRSLGAVGDICGRFFNLQGEPVPHEVSGRVIAIPLEELKRIPTRIAVTVGKEKAAAILGAIRGGYINVLITDERTAQETLRLQGAGRHEAAQAGGGRLSPV